MKSISAPEFVKSRPRAYTKRTNTPESPIGTPKNPQAKFASCGFLRGVPYGYVAQAS